MLTRTPFARFLLITLGITGLYLALDQVWLGLTPTLAPLANARTEAAWSDEAAEVERRSRAADRRAPPGWHVAAYRLGFEVGYCSNLLGSFTMSSMEIQAKAREAMEPRLASIRDLARALGLHEAPLVPVNNADQFGRISERVEADETCVAARVEQVASLRHRHLFLLGMHSGISAALADSLRGEIFNPLRAYLGRHATLAGVPLAAWGTCGECARRRHAGGAAGRVSGRVGGARTDRGAPRERRTSGRSRWALSGRHLRGEGRPAANWNFCGPLEYPSTV